MDTVPRPPYMLSTGDSPQNLFSYNGQSHWGKKKKKKVRAVPFIALVDNGRQTIFSSNSGVLTPSVSPRPIITIFNQEQISVEQC